MNLTIREAYLAMFFYLDHLYNITKSDDLGSFLGDMNLLSDGRPLDPAVWEDWVIAIKKAKQFHIPKENFKTGNNINKYTKADFYRDLRHELSTGFDVFKVAKWSYRLYTAKRTALEPKVRETLEIMCFLENDPNFDYSEKGLIKLLDKEFK